MDIDRNLAEHIILGTLADGSILADNTYHPEQTPEGHRTSRDNVDGKAVSFASIFCASHITTALLDAAFQPILEVHNNRLIASEDWRSI